MRARQKVQIWILHRQNHDTWALLFKTVPARGGAWQPVTGWVDEGEALPQAAAREVREETGFEATAEDLVSLDLQLEFDVKKTFYEGPVVETCFAYAVTEKLQPNLDPTEHSEACWYRLPEALKLVARKRV